VYDQYTMFKDDEGVWYFTYTDKDGKDDVFPFLDHVFPGDVPIDVRHFLLVKFPSINDYTQCIRIPNRPFMDKYKVSIIIPDGDFVAIAPTFHHEIVEVPLQILMTDGGIHLDNPIFKGYRKVGYDKKHNILCISEAKFDYNL
jgi:hypothetical protein